MRKVWIVVTSLALYLASPTPVAISTTCTVPLSCESSATSAGGVLLVCPAGDGPTLADIGATISVTLLYCNPPEPVVGLGPQDLWLMGSSHPDPRLCGGWLSSNADAPTDANGYTTISGSIAAVGYFGNGVYVFAGGAIIQLDAACDNPLPLVLVSPDIDGNFVVDGIDFALFAVEFANEGAIDPRMDFDGDGLVESIDFSLFARHFTHQCE